jgi:hypothetical protein
MSLLVLDGETRRFLRVTGIRVVAVEVAVLAAIWLFQSWFGN